LKINISKYEVNMERCPICKGKLTYFMTVKDYYCKEHGLINKITGIDKNG